MSGEGNGGVQGLRAWVSDAVGRVKGQLPGLGAGSLSPQAHEASVAELDQLSRLLDHDEGLRGSVTVWLAGALTLRHAAGGGTDTDRDLAERLLREARDRTAPLGAAVSEEDRRWAALFLMSHLSPIRPQAGFGATPDLSVFLDWLTRAGPTGMMAAATELDTLMADVVELPLPPELLDPLRQARGTFSVPSAQGLSDLLAGMMPADSPFADQAREMMDRIFKAAGGFGGEQKGHGPTTPDAEPVTEPEPIPRSGPEPVNGSEPIPRSGPEPVNGSEPIPRSGPEPVTEPEPTQRPGPEPVTGPEPTAAAPKPGPAITLDDVRHMAAALDAVNATAEGLDPLLRSGDPQALDRLLRRLRSVQDVPLPGVDPTPTMESLRTLLLGISPAVGGTYQDVSAGRAHMDTILGHLEGIAGSLPKGVGDPTVLARALDLSSRAMAAKETEDTDALRKLLAEAEALSAAVSDTDPLRFAVEGALGSVHASLGIVTRDKEALLRALPHMEKGATGAKESGLPFAGELPVPWMENFGLIRDALTGEATAAPEHVSPPPDASMEDLYASTLALGARFGRDRDPAVLDALIDELERLRDGVRANRAPRIAADALWHLAEAYHMRSLLGKDAPDPADTRALDAAEEALMALAADVLLQAGAEHGLLAARTGASRGVRAARMAASYGKLHEAVAALELGRALVLQAASTSPAVPELLEAAGRHDLAESWRAAAAGHGPGDAGEVPGLLPSSLRRQALDALGHRREGGLPGTPTAAELADGIAEAGADVLLYLVSGDEEGPGLVIAVGPELGFGAGALPQLSDVKGGPLARYVDAAAARDLSPKDDFVVQAWEEALDALCDWAFPALGPVLGGIEKRLAAADDQWEDRPLRVVLVPCGRLGIVPWHAARLPAEAAHERLCQVAVISYSASGGQFLRAVGRAPRDPAEAPVLVADPMMSLDYADTEVSALRDAFYPHARLYGTLYDRQPEEMERGTPDAVLGFLADGTSVLHVASHGTAGTRPTVSALDLESDEGGPSRLTITRLLDREHQQNSGDGPLVVLSACQTDLSKRDHDEALTLTAAFVAAGARDVVGSRWLAQDSASALLMAVFHHRLVVDGLSPVDALRAAQVWMLDPHREDPGSLQGDLLREMRRPGHDRPALWAAFVHQGHPGPSTTNTAEGTA
ncbi:CHAT domain-containing protein [Streptomyces sp. NPDC087538]|uniref:CHAT domain-containing protein n=1 Tax=Streptomyces sp. NPDC087538 TaxID=3365797 RepID=UPI003814E063